MSTNRTTRSRRRTLIVYAAAGLGAIALLGACSNDSDGPGISLPDAEQPAEQPEPEQPEPEQPEPEQPEPEQPEPEQPEPEQPADDEGLTTEEWVLLGILGFAVIAIIIGATGASQRRSDEKQAARAALNSRLAQITGMSRWVLDQASVEILRIGDPAQLRSSWDATRPRIIELESDIVVFAGQSGDAGLDQSLSALGQSIAGVRGALDTLVLLRTGDDAAEQQALIDDAVRTVQDRRQQLSFAISPVQAAQR